ncbi:ShlB/FhaC/HecB family hemolysin secretion/activation protein [Spirulina subsalsa FACHB-351]|uniref:ShlB/FhaC/HecB family hemolysin secretion/activation protein n=1 Tax=Spirulina subsalsa FACHB-351 TaxID=234711 RepID=A0ABT3L8C8_9CYAN|nr:ShlB/FhaC/HecB family hemolysin secretion/activation protein [Spirulina subsalsa]MCW6037771.1 ShlB/FhaC/HecB family hemolysin secretion/activation protein [Spirulina subsalsa FACHB-351]
MNQSALILLTGLSLWVGLTHEILAQASTDIQPVSRETSYLSQPPSNFSGRGVQVADQPGLERDEDLPQLLEEGEIFTTPEGLDTRDLDDPTPLRIERIRVEGSTVFTDADFVPILEGVTGETTLGQLNQAVRAITQLYLDQGYITSRAILPTQPLAGGDITILIVEGTLDEVVITGLKRMNPHYVRSRLNLGIGTPFNANALEDQLRLLTIDPNFKSIDVNLQTGEELGTSRLLLDIEEVKPFSGLVFTDNYSPESVGAERMGLSLGYRNLTGFGDLLRLGYTGTFTGGYQAGDFSYSLPVNPMNGTVDLRVVLDQNRITTPAFRELGIRGNSQLYDLSFRQPLVRSAGEELALSLGFRRKTGQTFLFDNVATPFGVGAQADGRTRTSVIYFGQDYTKRDGRGAWSLRSQFNLGTGLFGTTGNSSPTPDARFFSWLGQGARVQRLGRDHLLIVQGDVQLSPSNLLASEVFSMGGGQTLRGYRQGARSGDNGWRLSVEGRITLWRDEEEESLLQFAPFVDGGMVWNNPSNPSQIQSNAFLAGLGAGLIWIPVKNLTIRLDGTLPLINIRDRQTNAQDDGLYFSVNYRF